MIKLVKLEEFADTLLEFFLLILLAAVMVVLLPIWIIPYIIWKLVTRRRWI